MNICTICTEGHWAEKHLPRWVRYANRQNADLYLYWIGGVVPDWVDKAFKGIMVIDTNNRPMYNVVRMGACRDFGVDSILYCDCDADMIGAMDIVVTKGLGCVKNPVAPGEYNNGLLWLNRDWQDEYQKAYAEVLDKGSARIRGTLAFNTMLKTTDDWEEIPYKYSVIWWDLNNLIGARCVQYCNDQGQAKRIRLEEQYVDCGMSE